MFLFLGALIGFVFTLAHDKLEQRREGTRILRVATEDLRWQLDYLGRTQRAMDKLKVEVLEPAEALRATVDALADFDTLSLDVKLLLDSRPVNFDAPGHQSLVQDQVLGNVHHLPSHSISDVFQFYRALQSADENRDRCLEFLKLAQNDVREANSLRQANAPLCTAYTVQLGETIEVGQRLLDQLESN